MKRALRNLIFLALVLVFAAGILCSNLATPGQSLASVIDCSPNNVSTAMAGCEYPSYLCGFGSSSNLLFQGTIGPTRSNDLKNVLPLVVGEIPLVASNNGALLMEKERSNPSVIEPHKVSIRLFNSILNL